MDRVLVDRKPTALVQDFLSGAINSGAYPAGAKLPTERAIAEELGVPRSAVRDVLSVLEAQGWVVRIVGSGTYVAKRDVIEPAPSVPSDASPTEIMAARLIFEPRLAQLVVMNAKAADFERMEDYTRRGEVADDFEEFEHWDAMLHEAIAEATHNPLIVAIYATITAARELAEWGELKRLTITAERRDAYRQEHREIVAALRARDGRAAEAALTAHLLRVRRNLLGE